MLPLSIGDGELADTATCVVPLAEIFAHYLQRGRIDVGFLGAAQIDRFGNLNSTVIGDYQRPRVRLPGAGGAPEIASQAREATGWPLRVAEHLEIVAEPDAVHLQALRELDARTRQAHARPIRIRIAP